MRCTLNVYMLVNLFKSLNPEQLFNKYINCRKVLCTKAPDIVTGGPVMSWILKLTGPLLISTSKVPGTQFSSDEYG